jgi:hypothetical protein
MQPVYTVKANPSEPKTWMDRFVAIEPKGGVRDVVERMQNCKAADSSASVAHVYSILFEAGVTDAVTV